MADYTSDKVRNIVLVGQDGAGKTSLAEAMLHLCGKTQRLGTTVDGKSNMDYDPEEIKRQITISTSLGTIVHKGVKINVLDTPGSPDFIGDTIAALKACETAVFVVDSNPSVQIMTKKIWQMAEVAGIPRVIYINRIDKENSDYNEILQGLIDQFGTRLGAVVEPIGTEKSFSGIVDLLRTKKRVTAGGKETISELDGDLLAEAENARADLNELVAEADDDLMMKFFDEGEFTDEEFAFLLKSSIAQNLFVPVYVGSATQEQGVMNLLDDIVEFFPTPLDRKPYATVDGDEIAVGEGDACGFVFKTLSDPYVGRLSFVKVVRGMLKAADEIATARTGKKDRISHIYSMVGQQTEAAEKAYAGDIVVIPKLSDAKTNDSLSLGGAVDFEPIAFPKPLYPIAIEAADKKDEDKMSDFIAKQCEIDPCISLSRNDETHQTLLTTLGDGATDLILSRLKERSKINVNVLPVRVPYRESIRRVAQAQGRHKKQTGGAGQFGDCWLRLEPNPGGGYEFIDEVVGGRIPRGFIPAVDKGVVAAMEEGFLAGYPCVDIKCAVYDGSYHPVDSNEMAFKLAARLGFRAACEKADVYILEPMANLEVTIEDSYAGAIMGDFSTRRGRVAGMDHDSFGNTVIKARVPYAEVVSYAKDLRSITRGSGSYTIEVEGYEEAPRDVAQKLVAEFQASKSDK